MKPATAPMGSLTRAAVAATAAAFALTVALHAAGQQQSRERNQVQERTQERAGWREIIPGSELMTAREREDYRRRYAAAKTEAEKRKVRAEHVEAMEERARLHGLKLAHPPYPKAESK